MPHEYLPRAQSQETPVATRFSFLNRDLVRLDLISEAAMRRRRVLTYPAPTEERRQLRKNLAEKGLVLGTESVSTRPELERFFIPMSARPVAHEAIAEGGSGYTYNDMKLFHDLGKLLGHVAEEGPELPYALNGEVGDNVAIIEFTRVDEPRLLLVPGFELDVTTRDDDDHALNTYTKQLQNEFGQRFDRNAEQFIDGFREVIG